MAENAAQLLDHAGPNAKVVTWTHHWHVTKPEAAPGHGRMGLELKLWERHMVIGFAFNQGEFQARGLNEGKPGTSVMQNFTVGPAKPGSLTAYTPMLIFPMFALDLRKLRSGGLTSSIRSVAGLIGRSPKRTF